MKEKGKKREGGKRDTTGLLVGLLLDRPIKCVVTLFISIIDSERKRV